MSALPDLAGQLASARRALVIKPSSLGDIVHTLPAVALIKKAAPDLELRWVANEEWVPLLRGNTDLRSVIPFPRSRLRGPLGLFRFLRWSLVLREPAPPDMVFDFQGLLRSGMMAKRSRGRTVLGLSDSREFARFFHERRLQVDPQAHAVDRYMAIPRALGISVPSDDAQLEFKLPESEPESNPPACFVLLHPFSRGRGKSLSEDAVRRLCAALAPREVLIVGRDGPRLPGLPDNVENWMERTDLAQLSWLMARADYTISVDSGPAHMAAALGERLLSIHSWSNPLTVGPYRKKAHVWKAGEIRRVGDMDADWAQREGGLPDDTAIDAIAAHVLGEIVGA